MIEPIDLSHYDPIGVETVAKKLNELIKDHNVLEKSYKGHGHFMNTNVTGDLEVGTESIEPELPTENPQYHE